MLYLKRFLSILVMRFDFLVGLYFYCYFCIHNKGIDFLIVVSGPIGDFLAVAKITEICD